VKSDSKEAMQAAWIPEDQVKANEWFTVGGDDEEAEAEASGEAAVDAGAAEVKAVEEESETAGGEHK
jgi:hypothetical protein